MTNFETYLKLMLANIILQLSNQKLFNDILPIILFHSFFLHKSKDIINIEIEILQTSKNQYFHEVMTCSGNLKHMLDNIIVQLS